MKGINCRKGEVKWDDKAKQEFMSLYTSKGKEACVEKYNISIKTAYEYSRQWKNYVIEENDPAPKETSVATNDTVDYKPNNMEMLRKISVISNLCKSLLINYTDQNKISNSNWHYHMKKKEFIIDVGNAIYYRFLILLGIRYRRIPGANRESYSFPKTIDNKMYRNYLYMESLGSVIGENYTYDQKIYTPEETRDILTKHASQYPEVISLDDEFYKLLGEKCKKEWGPAVSDTVVSTLMRYL
jgi:hypothetical protein